MDDADFHHSAQQQMVYVQMSYDLRPPPQRCVAPHQSDLCLVAIDTRTGATVSSTFTNYTVYKYDNRMAPDNTVLVFAENVPGCASFGFARLNVTSAQLAVLSCMNAVIGATPLALRAMPLLLSCCLENAGQGQWISSFSADGTLLRVDLRWLLRDLITGRIDVYYGVGRCGGRESAAGRRCCVRQYRHQQQSQANRRSAQGAGTSIATLMW